VPLEHAPVDQTSAQRLAQAGLEFRLIDAADTDEVDRWVQADHRGFLGARPAPELLAEIRDHVGRRRTVAVFDAASPVADYPVATTQSWTSPLTVPGGGSIDHWSVSSVTVAPTHRRRGIARALLEGELRAAAQQGVPIAGLTVSETTIYGRYGFGVATFADSFEIETARVRWTGPETQPGRLHLIEAEQLLPDAVRIAEAAAARQPGGLGYDEPHVGRAVGALGDNRAALRTVRYDDAEGRPAGFATYELASPEDGDFAKHIVTVRHLVAATDEAQIALWRYFLELDLVATVRAPERPVDDPVLWLLGDLRAAKIHRGDSLWLRIIDVPVALEARRYAAAASIVLDVDDAYGFAAGRFLLETAADGSGRVERVDGEAPAGAASVALSIADLSSLYLGGVSPVGLARAGRIAELTPGAALVLERAFAADRAPWLVFGF